MTTPRLDRRLFLTGCGVLTGSAVLLPGRAMGTQSESSASWPGPQQDPDTVRQLVGVSHGNLDAVRDLIADDPELAKAAWDWGFGDWESALGAASHTGSRDIALLLLDNGARMNLFTAAMLGELAVVRAFIQARPGIQRTRGPHSLTLMHHARTGGEAAQAVVDYLESVGDADHAPQPVLLSDTEQQLMLGTYRIDGTQTLSIERRDGRDGLWLRHGDGSLRQLYMTEMTGTYHPAGAEGVHVSLVRDGEALARQLRIRWPGGRLITAARRPD